MLGFKMYQLLLVNIGKNSLGYKKTPISKQQPIQTTLLKINFSVFIVC